MSVMKPIWDQTPSMTYGSLRAKGMSYLSWWEAYGPLVEGMGKSIYGKFCLCFNEDESLKKVQDAMTDCRKTALGAKLFGKAEGHMIPKQTQENVFWSWGSLL